MYLVLAIVLNFYIDRIRLTSQMFIDSKGLFWQIKWRSICEAFINIYLFLIFTVWLDLKLEGIILALLLCNLFINFWWEAYVVFKYLFEKSIWIFLKLHFMYMAILVVIYIFLNALTRQLPDDYISFFLKTIITFIISNILLILFFYKTNEFKYMRNIIFKIIKVKQ